MTILDERKRKLSPDRGRVAPRRTRKVRTDIREEILDAALADFAAKGFEGASTREIARRIGAHQPQILYHFESKESLWRAAVDSLFARLTQDMAGLATGPAEPAVLAENFAEIIRRFVRFASKHPELNQIMMHEATTSGSRLEWMVERHVRPLYDTVRSFWRLLRKAGIAAPIDDRLLHYVLVGAASILYVNAPEARLLTGVEPTDRRWVNAHAEGLVAMLLPGAGPKSTSTKRRMR